MDDNQPHQGFKFHLVDYLVFGSMLVFSASVGVYFGYFNKSKSKRQAANHDRHHDNDTFAADKKPTDFGSKSMLEYLLGSRKLKSFPVAMSLVASYISGVTVLGTPAEIYNFGTQYWLIIFPIFLMGFIVSYVYLPVFCSLKVGSSYEVCGWLRAFILSLIQLILLLFPVFGTSLQCTRENDREHHVCHRRGEW